MVRKNMEVAAVRLPDITLVGFPVSRIIHASVLWLHDEFAMAELIEGKNETEKQRHFKDRFAYAIEATACFSEIRFDQRDVKIAVGERYGGRGIGSNGGGVRVGNFNGCQVKGIGQNPLVGQDISFLHSYGGLTASEATYEAIYAYLLDRIMPVGSVRINGIILTGPHAAYLRYDDSKPDSASTESKCWGALMVRETCRRPAHFLRSPEYIRSSEYRDFLTDDVSRVRFANRELLRRCNSAENFFGLLVTFLGNCSKQFAFGQVNGLAHGTLTPSNLAIDGRWLDLARCTFFPIAQNNGAFIPSNSEWCYPLQIVEEWASTFAKYTGLEFGTQRLHQYYKYQFERWRMRFLVESLGLNWFESGENDVVNACVELATLSLRIIDRPKQRTVSPPMRADTDDPQIAWLVWLTCGCEKPSQVMLHWSLTASYTEEELQRARVLYTCIAVASYRAVTDAPSSYCSYRIETFIQSMKNLRLREYFYKKRLDDVIIDTVSNEEKNTMQRLIHDSLDIVDWGFSIKPGKCAWLYRGNGTEIYRDRTTGSYVVATDVIRLYARAEQVLVAVEDISDSSTLLWGFQFKPYVRYILSKLVFLERAQYTI